MAAKSINFQRLLSSPYIKRASILVLTLWVLCFLAVFGAYLSRGVRQKLALVKSLSFRGNLHYIADAGLKKAIMELSLDETEYDALKDNWSNNPAVFERMAVGLGTARVSYFVSGRDGVGQERFGVIDEERKININTAHRFIIQRLLETAVPLEDKEAQEIAAAIVDWRDGDSMLSIPIGSAEDSYYRNLKEPYNCKDAAFQVPEEALLVKGLNKIIWEKIKNFVTIYGSGQVNINTAPREVLIGLGIEEIVAEKIVEYRAGDDGEEGTSDDRIFESVSSVASQVADFAALSGYELASLNNVVSAGFLTTVSTHFTVRATASIGQMTRDITCVVEKDGRVVSWREL